MLQVGSYREEEQNQHSERARQRNQHSDKNSLELSAPRMKLALGFIKRPTGDVVCKFPRRVFQANPGQHKAREQHTRKQNEVRKQNGSQRNAAI